MPACMCSRGLLRALVLCGVVGLLGAASSAQAKIKPAEKITPAIKPACTSVPLPAAAWGGVLCAATVGVIAVRRRKANAG